jgi:hypothetical protein
MASEKFRYRGVERRWIIPMPAVSRATYYSWPINAASSTHCVKRQRIAARVPYAAQQQNRNLKPCFFIASRDRPAYALAMRYFGRLRGTSEHRATIANRSLLTHSRRWRFALIAAARIVVDALKSHSRAQH